MLWLIATYFAVTSPQFRCTTDESSVAACYVEGCVDCLLDPADGEWAVACGLSD